MSKTRSHRDRATYAPVDGVEIFSVDQKVLEISEVKLNMGTRVIVA